MIHYCNDIFLWSHDTWFKMKVSTFREYELTHIYFRASFSRTSIVRRCALVALVSLILAGIIADNTVVYASTTAHAGRILTLILVRIRSVVESYNNGVLSSSINGYLDLMFFALWISCFDESLFI